MKRTWLKVPIVAVLSVAGWLAVTPRPAQAQAVAVAAGVWGWRNIVAPEFGGPWIAPDIRFRPFARLRAGNSYQVFPAADNQAQVVVRVPDANAQVWIQGNLSQATGTQRIFSSPRLEPGVEYTYEIRARWRENEQTSDQTRTVLLRPGQQLVVDFGLPASK